MSSTFTGIKLQGYLGKFGASELSDICAFVQLPDGKVLSSTETGNMLLWDGGMIKCEIGVKGRRLCHQGRIEAILLIEGEVITAGEDGLVRIWDFETIDNADVSTVVSMSGSNDAPPGSSASAIQSRVFEMEPMDEFPIAKDVKVKTIVKYPSSTHEYLIQDQQGHLLRLDLNKRVSDKLLSFHAGPIMSLDTSPTSHVAASLGIDGNIRVYDYPEKKIIAKNKYNAGGTCLTYLPESLDAMGKTVIAGFLDGVIRIVTFSSVGPVLQNVFKPHKAAVHTIAVSSDGKMIATGSEDNSVFFFSLSSKRNSEDQILPYSRSSTKITPLGFLSLPSPVTKVTVAPDDELYKDKHKDEAGKGILKSEGNIILGKRFIILTKDGAMYTALAVPNETVDNSVTFEIPPDKFRLRQWNLSVPEKVPEGPPGNNTNNTEVKTENTEQKPSEDSNESNPAEAREPRKGNDANEAPLERTQSMIRRSAGLRITASSPFTSALYFRNGYFLASVTNEDEESELRLCHLLMPSKSKLLYTHKSPITDIRNSSFGQYLLLGAKDGSCIYLRYSIHSAISVPMDPLHQTYLTYAEMFDERIEAALKNAVGNPDAHIEVEGQYWVGHGHDVIGGKIGALCPSFDDSYICSSGCDGGLFIWRVEQNSVLQAKNIERDLEEQNNTFNQPEDITDTNSYSIQEDKVRAERDREVEQAEARKQDVRNFIQELRNEFNKLLAENEKQTETKQLSRQEYNVDPFLHRDIEKDTTERITLLHKEMSWISEKESIGLMKIQNKYLDSLNSERIVLYSFRVRINCIILPGRRSIVNYNFND